MKKTRIISMILVLALMLSMLPMTVLAAEEEFKVTVSIEGLTLGQGFYVEPTVVTLDEINESLGGSYTGNGDLTAAMVTDVLLKKLGMDWEHGGTVNDGNFYLSAIKIGKEILDRTISIPQVIKEKGEITEADLKSRPREDWLGQMNYASSSGWMITVDDFMIDRSAGAYPVENGSVVRWYFTLVGYGSDLGSSFMGQAFYEPADKDALYAEYAHQAKEGLLTAESKAAAMAVMTNITASQEQTDAALAALKEAGKPVEPDVPNVPEEPRQPQDVSSVLNDVLGQMRATCTEPVFGTTGGEWTVLALARSGYISHGDAYFENYYDRIVKTVDETINDFGGLDTNKQSESSRLILALSAIGKDSRNVGGHDITAVLSNYDKVVYQGINGPIYALLALDTWNFETEDPTIRQQYIDYILNKQVADGGWALFGSAGDPDITGMALQALANYRSQPEVEAAVQRGIECMSAMQKENGGYASWGTINSESCAQIITACAALGINPDTDPRFVKDGNSVVDALLEFYDPASKSFKHDMGGGGVGAMSTDQACYALVAYQRLLNGQNSLYDMTDVQPAAPEEPNVPDYPGKDLEGLVAYLNMTEKVSNKPGTQFPVKVDIQGWDNEGHYKLMDCLIHIPEYVDVESVTLDESHFTNGKLDWHVDANRDLRVVFADLENQAADLIKTGEDNIVPFFTINMKVADTVDTKNEYQVTMGVNAMTVKLNSDSYDENSQIIVNIEYAKDTVTLCQNTDKPDPGPGGKYTGTMTGKGFNFTTGILYQGDNIDLIPESKMAICVHITNLSQKAKLSFKPADGEAISFLYNEEISKEAHVNAYVAILDSSIDMEQFKNADSYTLMFDQKDIEDCAITFGDTNEDGVVNAQDALDIVNTWLRKTEEVTDRDILHMNINCDSRVNTYDALGIMENFVDGHGFAVVNKATTIGSRVE